MPASKFVTQINELIRKACLRKDAGWTNIDSMLVHFGQKAIVAIEYKDAIDLESENKRRTFAWQKKAYRTAFADHVHVLAIVCDGSSFSFEVIALNDCARDWLGANSRVYSGSEQHNEDPDIEDFSALRNKFKRILGD